MTRLLAISTQLDAYSNIALAVSMLALFVTTAVLIHRNKTERD